MSALLRQLAGAPCSPFEAIECRWHGRCQCLPGFRLADTACPLHSPSSSHAAEHLDNVRQLRPEGRRSAWAWLRAGLRRAWDGVDAANQRHIELTGRQDEPNKKGIPR